MSPHSKALDLSIQAIKGRGGGGGVGSNAHSTLGIRLNVVHGWAILQPRPFDSLVFYASGFFATRDKKMAKFVQNVFEDTRSPEGDFNQAWLVKMTGYWPSSFPVSSRLD